MNSSFVALLLCFVLAVVAQERGFSGTWRDNNGFTIKLCLTDGGDALEGTYNDFGIVQAITVNEDGATGLFFNTRYQTDDECPRGQFKWHLNGNSIKGEYVCFDRLSGGEWNLDRIIPQVAPSDAECYTFTQDDDDDFIGRWNLDNNAADDDDWDICYDDNNSEFRASYGAPGEVGSSYQFGRVVNNGKVLQGSAITVVNEYGGRTASGVLVMQTENSDLVSFNWVAPVSNSAALTGAAGGHSVTTGVRRISRNSDDGDCSRNQYLSVGYDDDDDFVPVFVSSSAHSLTAAISLLVVVAFIML